MQQRYSGVALAGTRATEVKLLPPTAVEPYLIEFGNRTHDE